VHMPIVVEERDQDSRGAWARVFVFVTASRVCVCFLVGYAVLPADTFFLNKAQVRPNGQMFAYLFRPPCFLRVACPLVFEARANHGVDRQTEECIEECPSEGTVKSSPQFQLADGQSPYAKDSSKAPYAAAAPSRGEGASSAPHGAASS